LQIWRALMGGGQWYLHCRPHGSYRVSVEAVRLRRARSVRRRDR
jgi:hypothetical protein